MAASKRAEKAPDVITSYAVCRTDGTDWRDCPEGWTLENAKAEAFRLNRECVLSGIVHLGIPAEYEVRIVTREVSA